mmetsp:Transcript_23361/g.75316  ORF Transcript_23361/g.75316 Transcript_23361/m.75316 type:complete len:297 (+) Transcript_23361:306-1196(+)
MCVLATQAPSRRISDFAQAARAKAVICHQQRASGWREGMLEGPSRVVLVVAVPCAPHASRYCASSTTPCFFLPAESLISLAASKLAVEMSSAASSILTSLSLAPPPATSRRTSDLLFPSSSDTNKSTTGTPAAASSAESFTRLSDAVPPPPPPPPAAKSDAAVAWISARHASPCSMRVASLARTTLASLICAPRSASSFSTSSCGSSVKNRRKRPTSASAVFLQNCQYSYGERRSSLSQTAPAAVLPIFLPSAVVTSGAVRPKSCAPSALRPSSTPEMMFPHWSEPPNCSVAPCRR